MTISRSQEVPSNQVTMCHHRPKVSVVLLVGVMLPGIILVVQGMMVVTPQPKNARTTMVGRLNPQQPPVLPGIEKTATVHSPSSSSKGDAFIKESSIWEQGPSPLPLNKSPDLVQKQQPSAPNKSAASPPSFWCRPSPPPPISLPFPLLVDQLLIQQAIVLAITDPHLAGVALYGNKGTGKTTICRSAHRLLSSSSLLDDGSGTNQATATTIDDGTENNMAIPQPPLSEDESGNTPSYISIPVNCQEDHLLGTVDLEKSLSTGRNVFEPGLLARSHRGLLVVDDAHLLDDGVAASLWKAITDGSVLVEREGLSVEYPFRPQLTLVTFNPEEGETRDDWLDRLAMILPVHAKAMSVQDRVKTVLHVEGCQDKTLDLMESLLEEDTIRNQIVKARKILPNVQISKEQIAYICETASQMDCQGQRGEIFATEIAKTIAALDERTVVQASDLELAVLLALVPRARVLPMMSSDDQLEAPPPPPSATQPLPPDQNIAGTQEEEYPPPPEEEETQNEKDVEQTKDQAETIPDEQEEELFIPEQFFFSAEETEIDPKLLVFQKWTRKGKGGKRSRIFNLQRGRFVKAIFPVGDWKRGRLAVGATFRAAAPHQLARRRINPTHPCRIQIKTDDFRIKRLARKAGTLILFVVDASGSMALNRMGAAKGAAMCLLAEAYKSRDKICLIAAHDVAAEMLVPPTKSMAMTRARLEAMPCGGKSPLAHGLTVALRTALNFIKVKKDVGRAVIILISDGRPTVPLAISEGETFDLSTDPKSKDGQPSRSFCQDEVLAIAKTIGSLKDVDLLVIDTEDKFVRTGVSSEVARYAQGSYTQLSSADANTVTHIAKQSLAKSK